MILQALYDYYHRKATHNVDSIAPLGFQYTEIPFLVVIDENGQFIQLEDTREGDSKKRRAKAFLVPQEMKRPGQHSWKTAFLLWDKIEYVLGYSSDPAKAEIAQKSKQSFISKINALPAGLLSEPSIIAIQKFLEKDYLETISKDPLWDEIINTTTSRWFTFKLQGNKTTVCEEPPIYSALKAALINSEPIDDIEGICLITGKQEKLARLHPSIKAFGATGVSVVSFNDSAYCSYGKEQSYNAPVGNDAANAYTSALNLLLSKDSKQKISLAGTTVVFWAEREDERTTLLEDRFALLFSDEKDNPDLSVKALESLYDSPWAGKPAVKEASNRFFVLGLSPNKARLAIRFFHVLPLHDLEHTIRQHFEDLEICHGPNEREILPLRHLIRQLCMQGDIKNAPPNLEGAFFESIVLGVPYPLSILQALVRRIRAEQAGEYSPVNYARAALLKGFLNRWYRQSDQSGKEITVSLDEKNTNIGYCLGRLFAILERLQKNAHGNRDLDTSIRSHYYGAFSSTPVTVFSRLIKLSKHHLEKLNNRKLEYYYERSIQEIMTHIPSTGPPPILKLVDQGAFAVGYYHQRAFRKKDESCEIQSELQTVE